jgi:predicted Zn-dependent protease
VLSFVLAPVAWAYRTPLKPGWNMFSAQRDVEVGQQISKDAERQVPMLENSRGNNYVNNLGRKFAASAPGEKYPYQFKVVNDRAINALSLPRRVCLHQPRMAQFFEVIQAKNQGGAKWNS